jgi:S1-C subfamily serine protease
MEEPTAGQPQKLLTSGRAKLTLAAACGLVLTVGALTSPRQPQTAPVVPSERAAPLLEEQMQRREAAGPLLALQEIAGRLSAYVVPILATRTPSVARNDYSEGVAETTGLTGSGVFVSATRVLTHLDALPADAGAVVGIDGRRAGAEVAAYDRQTGLVLLHVPEAEGRTVAMLALDQPAPGTLAAAVGRVDDQVLVTPVYVTSVTADALTVGAFGGVLPSGTPVFNLAGELSALVISAGPQQRAVPARRAVDRLLSIASTGQRQSSLGVGYQALFGRLADVFGAEGVLVADVVPGGPAEAAGVRAGDVLVAVGNASIESAATADTPLSSAAVGTPTTLQVRRGETVTTMPVVPAAAYEVAMLARSRADLAPAPEARVLFPRDVLDAVHIPPSAQVISVDGRRLTTAQEASRLLRAARQPIRVLVREGSSRFFVIVEPIR